MPNMMYLQDPYQGPDVPPDIAQKLQDQEEEEKRRQLEQANRSPLEDLPMPQYTPDPRQAQLMDKMMALLDRPQMPFLEMQAGRPREMAGYQALLSEMDRMSQQRYNSDINAWQRQANILSGKGRYKVTPSGALYDTWSGQITGQADTSQDPRVLQQQIRNDRPMRSRPGEGIWAAGQMVREPDVEQSPAVVAAGVRNTGAMDRLQAKPKPGPAGPKPGSITPLDRIRLRDLDAQIKDAEERYAAAGPDDIVAIANELYDLRVKRDTMVNGTQPRASASAPPAAPVTAPTDQEPVKPAVNAQGQPLKDGTTGNQGKYIVRGGYWYLNNG